ncbi:1,2-phenylacetyl-CoA epoxidase subunit PaaE [Granulosicoccus antarcticus]|uniref:1,2-phenylacetyl-CoA epoxidase, subunit E n=1 Tax=Granulosicoccus antarcticus IMCC3135 TaxID=1192854 RepID=A0A2Z2NZW5_9GAMM|nr:1,2-phenylacetyl-CoA epoxidase subunit PaaE [Granulosicoccus antarcticus]ASJ76829.1 1,2-phenylacetyl-CoA epoxidase, subunit E [Granulosicoccus antarcticus IMCC3135]
MARFLPLEVSDVRRETRDAVVVTLKPQAGDEEKFDFIQGQYLTFRREFDGEELRRSYSICAGRNEGALRVGIKRVEGGCFSTWANEELKVGETIEAMPPMGSFHAAIKPQERRSYVLFAGGSGITPVLSLIKTTLAAEPASNMTLVYGNRSSNSIMFREELDDLKNMYMGRFSVVHVLESEAQDIDLFSGRIDAHKCKLLFKSWIDIESIDMAFICGPEPMMLAIAQSLREHGLRDEQIKFELFASSQPGRAAHKSVSKSNSGTGAVCKATVTIDGTTRVIEMPKQGQSVLEAALGASMDAPYACKAGVCSTCRAMVLEGEVEMEKNHALEDYEVNRGYVLTCQCYPLSDSVVVSYDL